MVLLSKGTSATATGLSAGLYTCTITDVNGCSTTKDVTITDLDTTPPVAATKNYRAILDATGSVTVNASALNFGSTDNCGIADYKFSTSGTVCATGSEGEVLVIKAPEGSVFMAVNFASYGNPSGTCGNYTQEVYHATNSKSKVEELLLGKNSATIGVNNTTFYDSYYGGTKRLYISATYGPSSFIASKTYTCADIGSHNAKLKVIDAAGNSAKADAIITVVDNQIPVITPNADITVNADANTCTYASTQLAKPNEYIFVVQ